MSAFKDALKAQVDARALGFDWDELSPVFDKVSEELEELQAELLPQHGQSNHNAVEEELGDLLFAIVNLARHLSLNPEQALQRATAKFQTRFEGVKALAKQSGVNMTDASLDELEALWQQVKSANK